MVLLDEPFSALDAEQSRHARTGSAAFQDCTVLLVTHDPYELSPLWLDLRFRTKSAIGASQAAFSKMLDDKDLLPCR